MSPDTPMLDAIEAYRKAGVKKLLVHPDGEEQLKEELELLGQLQSATVFTPNRAQRRGRRLMASLRTTSEAEHKRRKARRLTARKSRQRNRR
jgi:hypothetical protein